jgi:acyl-CoA synthetase (AMP-forming)/AMP-acid ligase II
MNFFFDNIAQYSSQVAVIDGEKKVTYMQLAALIENKKHHVVSTLSFKKASVITPNILHEIPLNGSADSASITKTVVAIVSKNNLETLVNYLALLQLRLPIIFISQRQLDSVTQASGSQSTGALVGKIEVSQIPKEHILKAFRVSALLVDHELVKLTDCSVQSADSSIDMNIALLLSTSGSTGESKQVLLSYQNIQANVDSICAYLPMQMADVTITTLPFNYSYGLSIINTHLAIGACIVMTQFSMMQREFWLLFEQAKVTNFGGVPHSYDMLIRLKFTSKALPNLRYFTQAGGKLAAKRVKHLAAYAAAEKKAFVVMYGQTEATARMSYAFQDKLLLKPDTIGQAIPGTRLHLVDNEGSQITSPERQGELIFYGDNVMIGYASSITDLRGRLALHNLHTGDLGYQDVDGDFFISGRIKRFIKLFGERISLDKVQTSLQQIILDFSLACVGNDCTLYVVLEDNRQADSDESQLLLAVDEAKRKQCATARIKTYVQSIGLHPHAVSIHFVPAIPMTQNAKIDYGMLLKLMQEKST